jgi:FkbM family methyltransferase
MNYYSQFGQDKYIYESFFPNKRDGVFVEIGASEPENGSNSLFFENLGWSGVLVEPNKGDVDALRKVRKSPVEDSAIYKTAGEFDFLLCEGYTKVLSGLLEEQNPYHLQRIQSEISQHGGSSKIVKVKCLTFSDLMKKYNLTSIDYLSVDTEGSEHSIISSIPWDACFPTCISVENNYNERLVFDYLTDKGYSLVKKLGCDEIYGRIF